MNEKETLWVVVETLYLMNARACPELQEPIQNRDIDKLCSVMGLTRNNKPSNQGSGQAGKAQR